jgi:hypothetical protein
MFYDLFEYSATYYAKMRMALLRCTKSRVASLKYSKTHIRSDIHNIPSFLFQQYVIKSSGTSSISYTLSISVSYSRGRTLITEILALFETPSKVSLYIPNVADKRRKILTKIFHKPHNSLKGYDMSLDSVIFCLPFVHNDLGLSCSS